MSKRTSCRTVRFTRPFRLRGIVEEQPAGSYSVETDEEQGRRPRRLSCRACNGRVRANAGLVRFLDAAQRLGARVWVCSEYGHCDVTRPVLLNRILRQALLMRLKEMRGLVHLAPSVVDGVDTAGAGEPAIVRLVGMLSLSAKMVNLSALPSPSVSSQMRMRSRPAPAGWISFG